MSVIESLELEIISNSTSAVKGLNTLSQSLGKLRNAVNGTSNSTNSMAKSNNNASLSYMAMVKKIQVAIQMIVKLGKAIYSAVKKSSDYIENVNLFTVSMGRYAAEAKAYAEKVSEVMGIDPGEWMRHQGIFQTLATGFGVAGDKAAIMSKNLTQLGYDISSFYNLSTEDAMEKLQSGLAGELEPLRRIGYDLSQAKLQATALELGIDKSISSMTQAEKSMLRYHAIMTQVTTVQGDMARTLDAPANQIRILKAQFEMLTRSIGNVFIPILNKILPYLIAVTKILREMVSTIADLVGFEMPEVDYSGVDTMATGAEETSEALDNATESAKELKSYMMGFDELNVINPNEGSSSSGDESVGAFDIELPEYDFLGSATNSRIDGIISKLKEVMTPIEELIDMTVEWVKALDLEPIAQSFDSFVERLFDAYGELGDLFSWVYTEVLLPISKWVIENGLPAAFDVLAKAIDIVRAVLTPLIEGIKELKPILEPIVSWIGDVVVAVLEGLGDIFSKVGDVFEEKGASVKDIVIGLGEAISAIWEFLTPLIDEIIPLIKNSLSIVGDMIVGIIEGFVKGCKGFLDFVTGVFTGDWQRAWDGVVNMFSGTWDMIVSIFTGAWELMKGGAIAAWEAIKGIFTPVGIWFYEHVITPIGDFFKGLWDAVAGFFVNLWNDIVAIWNTVATWFNESVIQPIINFFAPIVEWISSFFEGCWLIIQAVWVVASTWFDEKVIQPIVGFFKGLWNSISGFFTNLWRDIKGIWNTVATWFNNSVIQPVVNFFKGLWTSISNGFKQLWKSIQDVWGSVTLWFKTVIIAPVKTAFKQCCDAIGGFFSNVWLSIRQGVASAMNAVIGGIESAINWIIGGINKLIGGFDKIVQWAADILGQDWGGISIVQEVSFSRIEVPTYGDGGFPESGQAFIARENGIPEMVGTIGRRAAVANNEQIVESVASGVAEANGEQNALLREQNALLRALLEKDNGVYLDGRSLSNSVDKYKREQGRVLIAGGAL